MVEKNAFLANPKCQYHVSQGGEHGYGAHNTKNRDYYEYPSLSHFVNKLLLLAKWWKEKLFLQIHTINIVYPNKENMNVVPETKRMKIIMHIQDSIISRMSFNYKENGGNKYFSCKCNASISFIPTRTT